MFEVFTSFLFFNIFHRETISKDHTFGAILMVVGASIIFIPQIGGGTITGPLLILIATFCSPFGNRFQQKARVLASGETIMFLRSAFAIPCFLFLAILFKQITLIGELSNLVLVTLILNGVILFGVSKLCFLEAIHRLSVTRVIALGSIAPFITLIIVWIVFGERPELFQLFALIPLTAGVLLLTDRISLRKASK